MGFYSVLMGFNGDSMGFNGIYDDISSGELTKNIENGHRNSGFSHEKMVIFHCYVSSPEGTVNILLIYCFIMLIILLRYCFIM